MYISKENFMEANLSGICRINVIDYSDYIAEKSHDGGHYAFYTTFVKEEYDDGFHAQTSDRRSRSGPGNR